MEAEEVGATKNDSLAMDATRLRDASNATSSNLASGAQQEGACSLGDAEEGPKKGNVTSERNMCLEEAALSLLYFTKTEEGQRLGVSLANLPNQGGQIPLWIKLRGKWQAGVQCSLEDCPAATVKAMPTCGRKMYIVVFLPSTNSYIWTDWQLVCSITLNPEPLAFGFHESGRNSVTGSNLARQFMLKKIIVSMLDISDRLPLLAVVDCARHVNFWKSFSKEAAKATRYNELGLMLVKLKSMIIPDFLSITWVCNCFEDWKHQCEVAGKASLMEKLIKELKNAVLWNEVGKLWDRSEQMNMGLEWKSWKEFDPLDGMDEVPDNLATHLSHVDHDFNDEQHAGEKNFEQEPKRLKWEESALGGSYSQLMKDRCLVATSRSRNSLKGKTHALAREARNQRIVVQCSAFSVKKGRQCNKYASNGSLYCFKHEPGKSTNVRGKSKISFVNAQVDDAYGALCSGETVYGRRCSHKANEGSKFCLKHMMQDTTYCKSKNVESSSLGPDTESKSIPQKPINSSQETCSPLNDSFTAIAKTSSNAASKIEKILEEDAPNVLLKQSFRPPHVHFPRFRCKLCAQEFVEVVVLGQHWRVCHKKEAQQYFRGYLCHLCRLSFTSKKGLYRHRNIRHPDILSKNATSLVALCILCSEQFPSFEHLWEHVVASHPAQLCAIWPVADHHAISSESWIGFRESTKCEKCDQVFPSVAELCQHVISAHMHQGSMVASLASVNASRKEPDTSEFKYKCKICGLSFRLLPDLGRHHQAAHKRMQSVKVKNAESLSMPFAILDVPSVTKKVQKLNVRRVPSGHTKDEPITNERHSDIRTREQLLSEIENFCGPKVAGAPTNNDILVAAAVACCKIKLSDILKCKYLVIPERLALKAAKLCSEANVPMQFHREGYVCPNGCREFPVSTSKPAFDALNRVASFVSPSCFDFKENEEDENIVVVTTCDASNKSPANKTVLHENITTLGKEALPIPCIDKDVF